MKTLIASLLLILPVVLWSQGRVIINNGGYIVIDNGAKLVLENPSPNALSTSGTGGNLVSENEQDEVIWMIGTNTGTYRLPYTTQPVLQGGNGTRIPFTAQITVPGTGAGRIEFSTYETATDVNTPYPGMVTNVATPLFVVDRFWMVDVENYTSNPAAQLTFTYDDAANEIGNTNTIVESSLQAQRFNTLINDWELLVFGVVNPAANTVSGVDVVPAEFFEAWTLVNSFQPLPVTGLFFEAIKQDRQALLHWSTLTEINSDYYGVERSLDGLSWQQIGSVNAAGFSQAQLDYSFVDASPFNGINYYRIRQVDTDGAEKYSETRALNFGYSTAVVFPNPFNSTLYVQCDGEFRIEVADPVGRIVFSGDNITQIDMSTAEASAYMVRIYHSDGTIQFEKVIKQ